MNVRLSLEDLQAFNRSEDAVQLPDGSGYAGTLNVYHEIHCVVSVPPLAARSSQKLISMAEVAACLHVPRALLPRPG